MMIQVISMILALQVPSTSEYVAKNVSAKYLANIVWPKPGVSILQESVRFKVDDTRNVIVLTGANDEIKNGIEILSQLDVLPMKFRVRVFVSVPSQNRQWTTDSSIYNNTSWSLADQPSGISVDVRPRMLQSGKVDFTFTLKSNGATLVTTRTDRSPIVDPPRVSGFLPPL